MNWVAVMKEASSEARKATAPLLLAIDGGNSKTDVVVVGEDGRVIAMARGGGYRPHEIGEQAARLGRLSRPVSPTELNPR